MDMEAKVRDAIVDELKRQAADGPGLKVEPGEGSAEIAGTVDLESLAMAVVGAVSGGP